MANYISPSDVEAEIRADNAFSASTTPTKSEVEQWIEEASDEKVLKSSGLITRTVVPAYQLRFRSL